MFNLLILGELTDECGRVWRRNSHDLYILEITNPTLMVRILSHTRLKENVSANMLLKNITS